MRPPGGLDVLALLAEGLTDAEIADGLVVSQRTAEHQVAAVLAKLNTSTPQEAARRAAELGPSWAQLAGNRRPIVG